MSRPVLSAEQPLLARLKLLALLPPLGAALALWLALTGEPLAGLACLFGAALGGFGLFQAFSAVDRQTALLDRLGSDALLLARHGRLPARIGEQAMAEGAVGAVASALVALETTSAALDHLPQAALIVDPRGLVRFAGTQAIAILGDAVTVGSAVFDALERADLDRALAQLGHEPLHANLRRVDGQLLAVRLAALPDGSALLLLPIEAPALAQAGQPPHPVSVTDDLPLDRLPALVIDTETTGLDPARDRVVAIGAVAMTGTRRHTGSSIDRLVLPDVPIPSAAIAIHGLTSSTLAYQPPFAAVWPEIAPLVAGRILVGHRIAFDAAILRHEAERSGQIWPEGLVADAGLLLQRLDPAAPGNLDALARHLNLVPLGRHTALGDALLTAEIWARGLELAQRRGITTWGALKALVA